MSALGRVWHSEKSRTFEDFVVFAWGLAASRGSSVKRVQWWANVLYQGAEYPVHRHTGGRSFVYYLTDATVNFGPARYFMAPGDVVVFDPSVEHSVPPVEAGPGPRVSIAGNLFFR